jgi:phytoene/squalene synthetase
MTKEPELALGKLNFWKSTIEDLYQNKLSGDPLTLCLNETLKRTNLPLNIFLKMIEGRKNQINLDKANDIPQLIFQGQETHTPLLLGTMNLMRVEMRDSEELFEVLEAVAGAMGLVEMLKMMPYDLRNQVDRLPRDVANRHNLNFQNMWNKHTGVPNPDLFDAVLE